jgi:hypothetical protein
MPDRPELFPCSLICASSSKQQAASNKLHRPIVSRFLLVAFCLLLIAMLVPPRAVAQAADSSSLGEIARELRQKKQTETRLRPEDVTALFASLDQILDFASKDTGFPKRGLVKRQLVDREYVEAYLTRELSKQAREDGLARSEIVLKKFGLLPANFELKDYLVKATARQLGGFYNLKDKTMYLLNWVPLELQRPVMAHELTHALQDQNYDLSLFTQPPSRAAAQTGDPGSMAVRGTDEDEHSIATRALIEGQAMVVFLDYQLRLTGHSLANSPDALSLLSSALQNYESAVALHDAPRVLRESTIFPYREGLLFEVELLRYGGKPAAFAGAFARVPTNTYQILHPDVYLAKSDTPNVQIPDIRSVLGNGFELFDSGTIGALDTRIMVRDFGRENDLFTVAAHWAGGSYVAVKRAGVAGQKLTPADISLFYVSRWKTAQAANRFAYLYKSALNKRELDAREETIDNTNCVQTAPCKGPVWLSRLVTKEGPAYLEVLPNNTVMIAQGFGDPAVSQLRALILRRESANAPIPPSGSGQALAQAAPEGIHAMPERHELSLSLYESPSFLAFQNSILSSQSSVLGSR